MELMEIFKQSLEAREQSENTYRTYKRSVDEMLEVLGKEALEVTFMDLELKWIEHLKNKGNSNRTINLKIDGVSSFYRMLAKYKLINEDPTKNLNHLKFKTDYERNVWTKEEIKQVIECCKNKRDKAIISFLLNVGCRIEEVLSLKIEEYNKECIELTTKGNKPRRVYLSDATRGIIDDYIVSSRKECIEDVNYLFVGNQGKKCRRDNVNNSIKKCIKQAGFEGRDISSHNIRSTVITELIHQQGIEVASKLIGHKSINTTMIYFNSDNKLNEEIMRNF